MILPPLMHGACGVLQAADNFGYELAALRRSFRYNEYQEMEAPPNFFARVRHMHTASSCWLLRTVVL